MGVNGVMPMRKFIPFLLAVALLFGQATVVLAQAISGDSPEFSIAIDSKTKVITGYYNAFVGFDNPSDGPQFSCIYFLKGKAIGKQPYKIVTWFPGSSNQEMPIKGHIKFANNKEKNFVTIKLQEDHGGCWNVQQFASDEGAELELDRIGRWKAIRIVSAKRAYFHSAARLGARQKTYVTQGDPLRVFSSKSGWLYAEYLNADGNKTLGWVKESDTYADTLPK